MAKEVTWAVIDARDERIVLVIEGVPDTCAVPSIIQAIERAGKTPEANDVAWAFHDFGVLDGHGPGQAVPEGVETLRWPDIAPSDAGPIALGVRVPRDLHRRIIAVAAVQGLSMNAYCVKALVERVTSDEQSDST